MVYQINIFMFIFSFVLVLLLESTFLSGENSSEQKAFRSVFHYTYLFFAVEIAWNFLDGRDFPFAKIVNYVLCIISAMASSVTSYKWYRYFEILTNPKKTFSLTRKIFDIIPLIIFLILSLTTFLTKWLFYIDDKNFYVDGTNYWIYILTSYFYIALVVVCAIFSLRKKVSTELKKRYLIIGSYSLFPILTVFLKLFNSSNLTIVPLGIVLSLICVYINIQQQKITRDGLTMLNNRTSLEKFMDEQIILFPEKRNDMFLMLIDVQNFKKINDIFGYTEGDILICDIAEGLKKLCNTKKCFLARFSGAIFAVLTTTMEESDIENFSKKITSELSKIKTDKEQNVNVNVTYLAYDPKMSSTTEWISSVRKKLSDIKNSTENDKS